LTIETMKKLKVDTRDVYRSKGEIQCKKIFKRKDVSQCTAYENGQKRTFWSPMKILKCIKCFLSSRVKFA